MADYSGTAPVGYGEGATGQYYQEVKWADGSFYVEDGEHITSKTTLTNDDHREPKYYVDFTLDENKKLTVTFKSRYTSSAYYFGYKVGYEAWDEKHKNDVIRRISANIWSWRGNANIANSDLTLEQADLSGLEFPIYIRAICDGCPASGKGGAVNNTNIGHITGFAHYSSSIAYGPNGTYGGGAYKIVKLHNHINTPNAPIIVKTSGTTITVKCDSSDASAKDHRGYVKNVSDSGTSWFDGDSESGCTFTEIGKIINATMFGNTSTNEKKFKSRRYCGDDCTNTEKYIESSKETSGSTWGLKSSVRNLTSNSVTLDFYQTFGTNGDTNTQVKCRLYSTKQLMDSDNLTQSTGPYLKESTGGSATFADLSGNTTYWYKAWSIGVVDETGKPDNIAWGNITTTQNFKITKHQIDGVSATTAKITMAWEADDSSFVNCHVVLVKNTDPSVIQAAGFGHISGTDSKFVVFTDLEPGTSYTATYNFSDGTTSISFTQYLLTKAVTIYNISSSSRAIKYMISAIGTESASDALQTTIDDREWQDTIKYGITIQDYLEHNTTHIIKAKILGCYAYDVNTGQPSTVNDSITTREYNTCKLLAIFGDTIYTGQHTISFNTETYLNGAPYTADPITRDLYKVIKVRMTAIKDEGFNGPPSNGGSSGGLDFGINSRPNIGRTIVVHVNYYYCHYKINFTVTDGYNEVTSEAIDVYTEFPYSLIRHNDSWKKIKPYVYHDGKWMPAPIFTFANGKWNEAQIKEDETDSSIVR